MVIAYHLIWTAYGWWLPNDPRGSMSHFIASDVIAELGELHYGRKRVQPASKTIRDFYTTAPHKLKFDLVQFSPSDITLVAATIADVIRSQIYTCYACAIMPDHVHLVIRKHKHLAEQMIANFQETSRTKLLDHHLREPNHPLWGGPGWKVFLDHPDDVHRTIAYAQNNPIKSHRPPQHWPFVQPLRQLALSPRKSPAHKVNLHYAACGFAIRRARGKKQPGPFLIRVAD